MLYSTDFNWWDKHRSALDFAGEKWTTDTAARDAFGINWIKGEQGIELSARPGLIRYGSNSGFAALNLALLRGAKMFVLLGYDMQGLHWFGSHPQGLNNPTDRSLRLWCEAFNGVPEQLDLLGCDIVNCSRSTAIEKIRRATIREILQ